MTQFFAYRDKISKKLAGYCSDDSQGFNSLPATLEYIGPYPDMKTAQAALEPAVIVTSPEDLAAKAIMKKGAGAMTPQDQANLLIYLGTRAGL